MKYTPAPGRVNVAVTLEKGKRGSLWCCVKVSDTGYGIPVAEHERIFKRFYRAEHTAHIPGSGLGLALAKAIAEQHGGSLLLQQAPSWQTVISLSLPAVRQGSSQANPYKTKPFPHLKKQNQNTQMRTKH